MPKKVEDLQIGATYGSWKIIAEVCCYREKYYKCCCECGTEGLVAKSSLRLGKSKSCGKGVCKTLSITHGKTNSPLYSVWCGIRSRVKNPVGNNSCYVNVPLCEEWNTFDNFYAWAITSGYEAGLSIDRKDGNLGYCPENCRWTDPVVQSQNRKGHQNAEIPLKGVYRSKPRNGELLYANTGKAPYYFIVIYKGKRHQKWGFSSPEEAYKARCKFIAENYADKVMP